MKVLAQMKNFAVTNITKTQNMNNTICRCKEE